MNMMLERECWPNAVILQRNGCSNVIKNAFLAFSSKIFSEIIGNVSYEHEKKFHLGIKTLWRKVPKKCYSSHDSQFVLVSSGGQWCRPS